MPEMAPPAAGAPQGGPPGQTTQQPFGSNPAMGATPNRGFEAAGLQKLGVLIKEMETLLPMFGAASEVGKAILDSLRSLSKHIPTGAVSPASQRTTIQDMALRAQQNGQMQQSLDQRRQQAQQPQGAA